MAKNPSAAVAIAIPRNNPNLRSLFVFIASTVFFAQCQSCLAFQLWEHRHSTAPLSSQNSRKHRISIKPEATMTTILAAAENSDSSSEQTSSVEIDCLNDGSASSSSSATTATFKSLQKLVDSISNARDAMSGDGNDSFTCRLIPSVTGNLGQKHSREEIASIYYTKGENNATIVEINTLIFRPAAISSDANSVYAVAIVPSSKRVDVRAFSEELGQLRHKHEQQQDGTNGCSNDSAFYQSWELAPSHLVLDLCGYSPGGIPPLLVPPRNSGVDGGNIESYDQRKPWAVVLDSSLLPPRNYSSSATQTNQHNQLLLLGGGGNTDYRCLIDAKCLVETVLEANTSDRNVKIASIVRFDGGMTTDVTSTRPTKHPSAGPTLRAAAISSAPKPFFQIAPPSSSMDYYAAKAELELQDRPHRPVPVTAIGRLTSVRQIAKRLVFADFAPPDHVYATWLANKNASSSNSNSKLGQPNNYDKGKGGVSDPPWRSGEDGKDMYVQIIVGKTFCERYDDGTDRLKKLKPGALVLVKGAANVDPMQKNGWRNSAGNWAQKRSLDVIVSSFEILNDDDDDENLRMLVEEAQEEAVAGGDWSSLLPWERKRGYERRAVAGNKGIANGNNAESSDNNNSSTMSSSIHNGAANELTFDRFNSQLRDSPLQIEIVDTDESIRAMSKEISEMFSRIEEDGTQKSDFLDYVAGIDCEWRPTGAYAEALLEGPDDNPVALLQICVPSIKRVYLVDTHRTLRANLAVTEQMNDSEEILAKTIGSIFGSDEMIKVGYSVAIDFRRLAASFPHISAFRDVRSVVELSTLAERLHPKSARPSLGSLQRLTKLVLGYSVAKEQQCSNWEARPLTSNQVEYAALDCALPPRLLDQMTEGSGTARMKQVLPQVTSSWRFQTIDSDQKVAIQLLKAKRVVGNTFVVSQNWLQHKDAPDRVSVPKEGGGPFVDKNGIMKMPANMLNVASGGANAPWKKMVGSTVGKSKAKCIDLLVGDTLPKGANLEYNPRSGYVAFKNCLALFVNMPDPNRPSRRMPYPNEWLEDGRILTWYIRPKDWDGGTSKTGKLLLGNGDPDFEGNRPRVVLFTRIGNGEFVCCGSCKASAADSGSAGAPKTKLVKLNLHLEDWNALKNLAVFSQLLETNKSRINAPDNQEKVFYPVSFRNHLARKILDGDVIGAFGTALNEAKVSTNERSIATGVKCVKNYLSNSDDPVVLQAIEIIEGMV
ncbi:unnamed protein product [Pseudo-nitzschia multistriata]|uniref:3'-5' exonuclease domain-containing protein n=1 Tax=Pseudo-nitzschia multistriata TaxID=183589 RepID=A0A448YYD1_9STRA|nr:unnamed protein product [Pseudo-nitzschia multistriata]